MTALNILPPFSVFTDSDGTPLDAGYIYIGTANLPPQTNPITVYWDEALTIPAAQPIRTTNGYPSRAGTPARLYVGSTYSILVADSKNVPVLSAPESFDYATVSQVQDSSLQYLTSVSGVNTITAAASVPPTAYVAGQTFRFVAPNTNSGAVTLNVNGLGAKAVTKFGLTALIAYDIQAGSVVTVVYDGTRFQLVTPVTAVSQYMNTARILGRTTSFPGVVQELTVGTGLSLAAGVLDSAAREVRAIGATVAVNAMTVTLAPTTITFRSATLNSGAVNARAVSNTLSLTIPSGATLGTINAVASNIVVLAIDNAGTVELAVVNVAGGTNLDETGLVSTTAISAGSNSSSTIYSASARSNVPYRIVGIVTSTQATAGTWASSPALVQGAGGQAVASLQSIGYGQTWQDVTGSRAFGVTYYNTTARPIFVVVTGTTPSLSNGAFELTVSGVVVARNGIVANGGNSGAHRLPTSAIVPPGASYSAAQSDATSTLNTWVELR